MHTSFYGFLKVHGLDLVESRAYERGVAIALGFWVHDMGSMEGQDAYIAYM